MRQLVETCGGKIEQLAEKGNTQLELLQFFQNTLYPIFLFKVLHVLFFPIHPHHAFLEAQVAEYNACIKEIRKLSLRNAENEQKLRELIEAVKEQLKLSLDFSLRFTTVRRFLCILSLFLPIYSCFCSN